MEPLYDLYYLFETILKRVKDVNADRAILSAPKNQWIWPEIPTELDKSYPRLTIQFLNLEEQPISAGQYISDNFKTDDIQKKLVHGKLYNVTIWIGLFVKTELKHTIERPDSQPISAKNALLSNLLFTKVIDEIDKAEGEIRDVAFSYKPFEKDLNLGYEDETSRIISSMSINVSVLAEREIIFNEDELIQTITDSYNVT